MIHQVLAYRVMPAREERDLQLGAYAVGGADQHRLLPSGERITGAEAADVGQHVARKGGASEFLNGGDSAVSLIDADASVLVADHLPIVRGFRSSDVGFRVTSCTLPASAAGSRL